MCSLDNNTDVNLPLTLPALPNYQQSNNVGENVANIPPNNVLVPQGNGTLRPNPATATVLPKTQNIQIQTVLPTQQIQSLQQQQQQHENNLLQQYYLNEINKEIDEEDQGCFCCHSDDDDSDDETRQIKYKEQKKKLVRTVCKNSFLFLVLIIYIFFGSLIFLLIENNRILTNNSNKQNEINNTVLNKLLDVNIRNKVVENIWDITVNLNILYRENWTRLAEKEMNKFQYDIVKKLSKEIKLYGNSHPSLQNEDSPAAAILEFNEIAIEWNLAKTFFYSLSIVTTIGYANTYENKSQTTKLITIIYTIIGLPIFLIYVTNIGLVLAQFAKNCFIHSMCCCLCSKCGYCCYDEILMEEKERRMRVKRQRNEFKKELEKGNLNQPYYLNINYVHEYNNYKHKTKDFQKRTEKTKLIAPLVLSILIICAYILLGSIFICNLEPGVLLPQKPCLSH
ncbi:uncharacterized protein LOC103510459 [Diaphorina citri]|uniref:Uncharacterized protein LOC103510459 n=1 Tax=Diaphorina citri TaxID=121845 RepID=A0A1S3D340_DIACI|nr:uncharacterized protein LOC103510459 [Diaphorina citri]